MHRTAAGQKRKSRNNASPSDLSLVDAPVPSSSLSSLRATMSLNVIHASFHARRGGVDARMDKCQQHSTMEVAQQQDDGLGKGERCAATGACRAFVRFGIYLFISSCRDKCEIGADDGWLWRSSSNKANASSVIIIIAGFHCHSYHQPNQTNIEHIMYISTSTKQANLPTHKQTTEITK